jgi:hypothetical protein
MTGGGASPGATSEPTLKDFWLLIAISSILY